MAVETLEHYTIRCAALEATRVFYENVLGLKAGPRPDFDFPGYWIYCAGTPMVHLIEAKGDNAPGTGALDHIAFRATGLAVTLDHLRAKNIPFTERQVDDQGLYQLFLHDPHGIKIELNFAAAEATDRRAPVMAADLR